MSDLNITIRFRYSSLQYKNCTFLFKTHRIKVGKNKEKIYDILL